MIAIPHLSAFAESLAACDCQFKMCIRDSVIGGLGPPGQAEPEGSGTAERVDDALGLFDKAVHLPGLPVDAPARRFRDLRRRGQRRCV